MGVYETWWCDFHEPDEAGDYVQEDEARDSGWKKLRRSEVRNSALPSSARTYTIITEAHVCPTCQADPEKMAEVERQKWTDEDVWPLRQVKVA